MRLVYRYRSRGQENLPDRGPAMLVVNHLHIFDPGAVVAAIPQQLVTLAAGKWRDHLVINTLLRIAGVIFVKRGEVDRQALRACLEVLESGGILAIAPEGTRSETGQLQRGKPGVAYLAAKADVPLIPVAHWGVENLSQWKRLHRPQCQVVIGEPFRLPPTEGRLTRERLQALADFVMVQIGKLLPEHYHGFYAEQIAQAKVLQGD